MKRVVFDVLLFISIFIFPWWVSLCMILVGIFIFNNFYEFIITFVALYSLYSVQDGRLVSSPVFFSLVLSVAYLVVEVIKKNIILYKNEI